MFYDLILIFENLWDTTNRRGPKNSIQQVCIRNIHRRKQSVSLKVISNLKWCKRTLYWIYNYSMWYFSVGAWTIPKPFHTDTFPFPSTHHALSKPFEFENHKKNWALISHFLHYTRDMKMNSRSLSLPLSSNSCIIHRIFRCICC